MTGIEGKICDILGFCLTQQKVVPGMLAEATTPQIKVNMPLSTAIPTKKFQVSNAVSEIRCTVIIININMAFDHRH